MGKSRGKGVARHYLVEREGRTRQRCGGEHPVEACKHDFHGGGRGVSETKVVHLMGEGCDQDFSGSGRGVREVTTTGMTGGNDVAMIYLEIGKSGWTRQNKKKESTHGIRVMMGASHFV